MGEQSVGGRYWSEGQTSAIIAAHLTTCGTKHIRHVCTMRGRQHVGQYYVHVPVH